jgi:tetratricopeptide (TPR) repeat protein
MIKRTLIVLFFLSAGCVAVFAQDEATLKQRIQGRAEAVSQLIASGLAQETSNGLLQAVGQADSTQAATIQAENKDRQAVFALIASKSRIPVEQVVQMYAARARKAAPTVTQAGYGPCKLVPAKSPDIARLLQYLKQGMNYSSQKRFDLALPEFQSALAIDKNFLALNQDVGAAQMALKKYVEAETALKAELKLVDCLTPLNDTQLSAFAYFIEVDEQDPVKRKKAQTDTLKMRIPTTKADVHYNLACLYSLQKQKDSALEELRAAIDSGFSDKKALSGDPDLSFVRGSQDFRDIAAKVH